MRLIISSLAWIVLIIALADGPLGLAQPPNDGSGPPRGWNRGGPGADAGPGMGSGPGRGGWPGGGGGGPGGGNSGPTGPQGPNGRGNRSGRMLERLDQNRDGVLQANEIPERMRGMIDQMAGKEGAAAAGNLKIATLVEQAQKNNERPASGTPSGSGASAQANTGVAPKTNPTPVPSNAIAGFGEPVDRPPVPGFEMLLASVPTTGNNAGDPKIKQQVDQAMQKYDANRNDMLDKEEWANVKWNGDPPQTSDTNGDGRLTRAELTARIAKRLGQTASSKPAAPNSAPTQAATAQAQAPPSPAPNWNPGPNRSGNPWENSGQNDGGGNGNGPWGGNNNNSNARGGNNNSGGGPPGGGGSEGSDGNRRRYAENMLKRFDTNKNGILEQDEWSKMPGRSTGDSDTNKDGNISLDELVARLSSNSRQNNNGGPPAGGGNGGPPSGGNWGGGPPNGGGGSDNGGGGGGNWAGGPPNGGGNWGGGPPGSGRGRRPGSNSANNSGKPKTNYRFLSPTERLPNNIPDWYRERDENGDGQLSMSEYASTLNTETVAEFNRYDLNGDGFITAKECLKVN